VAILNRPVSAELGKRIAEHFVEVLMAPGYAPPAVEALSARKGLRILDNQERRLATPGERDFKRVLGGVLIQDRDLDVQERDTMTVVTGELDERAWGDLLFAWRVCKHVSSNAIVIARDLQTIGVGAGQMSRVDSVRIAIEKARENGHDLTGASLASDAFFPFADGPQLALDAGIAAIVQPGGSVRDAEVIEAVAAAGATMVATGRRHFRH
jgi:phosphoribosylaminoimidazolecarboxamide formyltransferase/IMP cyclohydrolase